MRLTRLISRLFQKPGPAEPLGGPGITRRGFAGAAFAGLILPEQASAVTAADLARLDRSQLAAMPRAIADLYARDDDVLARTADSLLEKLTDVMPEAPVLVDLHRHYRGDGYGRPYRPETRIDLAALHQACLESRPVSFSYTDLHGNQTRRRVRPLELFHPGRGILLLAYCELRQAQRKFYVHAMQDLAVHTGDFNAQRPALLAAALEEIREA